VATDGSGGNGRRTERIMTPEEQVIEVVSANGGGMKQAEIVSSLDWSESTVSRKLSDLESKNAVTRYQIGREKIVYLPGAEPETLDSPFGSFDADRGSRA
jgi:predicted transcriptional regulator